MRNIILFIKSSFNLVFFVLLQLLALSMLFRYNKFHEAAYMRVANEITGKLSSRFGLVKDYFSLKKSNESLIIANEDLLNQLKENLDTIRAGSRVRLDSMVRDSMIIQYKWKYRLAKVAKTSISLQDNFLLIHRGTAQGVVRDMGVVTPSGAVVGVVVDASDNYASIITLLHRQNGVSGQLKKTGELGEVKWDGKNVNLLTMTGVPKSVKLEKGDTVITSSSSDFFPRGKLIGSIAAIVDDKQSNFFTLKLKPFTNFGTVDYVEVIANLHQVEQRFLEKRVDSAFKK
jgi:rod shape-determining protein MreC